jgi:hypothetical protein
MYRQKVQSRDQDELQEPPCFYYTVCTDTSQVFLPTPPHYIGPTTNSRFSFHSYTSPIAPIVMKIGPKNSKMAQLSTYQRSAIIYAHENGATQVQFANDFGCSRRTIYNTLKRYLEGEKLENREKSGRPVLISERACSYLYL